MKLDRFMREREPAWRELEDLLAASRGRPERLGPPAVRRMGALYRGAVADLALARTRFPRDQVVGRLERLVVRSRTVVYRDDPRRETLREFAGRGYWRRVRERPALVLAAWALLLVPALLACAWALDDPAAAVGVVPEEFRSAGDPGDGRERLAVEEGIVFTSALFTNNVQVSLLAFAGGILAGLGTVLVAAYNGLLLGALCGIAAGGGNGAAFVELVTAHGVLELSLIAVCVAAGLRVGWSIVSPGPRRRGEVLVAEARDAIEVVLGSIPFFIVAAVVEANLTARLGLEGGIAFGVMLGAAYWGLVLWRGRPAARGAGAPARPA